MDVPAYPGRSRSARHVEPRPVQHRRRAVHLRPVRYSEGVLRARSHDRCRGGVGHRPPAPRWARTVHAWRVGAARVPRLAGPHDRALCASGHRLLRQVPALRGPALVRHLRRRVLHGSAARNQRVAGAFARADARHRWVPRGSLRGAAGDRDCGPRCGQGLAAARRDPCCCGAHRSHLRGDRANEGRP